MLTTAQLDGVRLLKITLHEQISRASKHTIKPCSAIQTETDCSVDAEQLRQRQHESGLSARYLYKARVNDLRGLCAITDGRRRKRKLPGILTNVSHTAG